MNVVHEDQINVIDIVGLEIFLAELWGVLEASTHCVENSLDFKLASEGLVVNHD